jgi:hypothetical protein
MAKNVIIDLKINTKDGVKSIGDVNTEVKTTLTTMREMEEASQAINEALKDTEVGTEEYQKLSKELIKVNTELKNQELALEALDHEQVASEIKSVAGGLTDMAAGFTLVGVSSQSMEQVVQTMAKVEGISKIVTGAMEGYSSMMKLTGTITKTLSAWQAALAVAQTGTGVSAKIAAVGMRILNAVMSANPVLLIVAGIGALIGALALFSGAEEDAAEKAEQLNKSLEKQLYELNRVSNLQSLYSNKAMKEFEIQQANQRKIIEQELKMLELIPEKTKENSERIQQIKKQLYDFDVNNIKESTKLEKEAVEETIKNKEEQLTQTIITWNKLDEQSKKVEDDVEKWNEIVQTMNQVRRDKNALEDELAALRLHNGTLNSEMYADLTSVGLDYNLAMRDAEIKLQEERKRIARERRKDLLDEINEIIARQKAANSELEAIEIGRIENLQQKELELQELSYGEERQALIDGAIEREIKALEQKFLDLKISEEQFMQQRQSIVDNGINNLIAEEQKLMDAYKTNHLEQIALINQRFQMEAELTSENTDLINSNRLLSEVRYQKERDLLFAEIYNNEQLTEKQKQEKILKIKQDYLQREIDAIKANVEQERQLRQTQYEQDIQQKGLTDEKKKEIEAQYLSDIQEMNQTAFLEIERLRADTMEESKTAIEGFFAAMQGWVDGLSGLINQTVQTLQLLFDTQAETAAAKREEEYRKDSEGLKAMYANKLISEAQYNEQVELLEQDKRNKERNAKKKAFQQNKAIQITNAVMQTAQAVLAAFSSAAAIPIAGIALGPIMAGIAGALGVAQIAIISSQKFQGARGGIVPGNGPSHIDSVDAFLAPGETVINAESSRMFPQLLSTINQAGGGISLAPEIASQGPGGLGTNNPTFKENREPSMVKAYVVESEMTDVQKKISRIEKSAQF